ncbi:MAG: tetratricopeptide repeat protein [bacterium]|nr:tetratricopeptide repeat protein [bacterium]
MATSALVLVLVLGLPLGATETSPRSRKSAGESERVLEAALEFARGKLLADEGSFDKAQKAYSRALELDGSDPYSRIEVAKFHAYLAQISRSTQKRLEYLQSAAGYAGESRRVAPENIEILRDFAQIHMRLGEHQLGALTAAQEAYEELRGKTEGDLQVLTSLGQIYLWKQQGDEAVEVLQEAASYLPSHRMIQTMLLEALLGQDRDLEAEPVLEQLIRIEPDSIEHHLRLAELRAAREDHRGAVEALSAVPGDMRQNPRVRQFLAQELHLSGANDEALALTEALRNELPRGAEINRLRVAIYSAMTRYEEAIDELEPLIRSEQDEERALQGALHLSRLLERVGRSEDAALVLRERLAGQDAGNRLQLQLAVIGILERHGRRDEAIQALETELEAAETTHVAMLGRALSDLLRRGARSEEALAVLDRTIARLGDSPETRDTIDRLELERLALLADEQDWQGLTERAPRLEQGDNEAIRAAVAMLHADALAGLGQVDEALELLDRTSGEEQPRALAKRAEILFESGREADARELIQTVIDGDENSDLLLAAQVYQRIERYSESIPHLERLLARESESLQALFLLGAARERVGDQARAVAAFQSILELAPDHAPTLNYLGYMWAELGENLGEAASLILRAVAIEPDNGAYVDSLGWVYFQLGRYEEARGHLEWAARLIPDDATIFEHLGDLYVVLDDVERARSSYRQALDLGVEDIDGLRRKLETLEKDL